MMKSNKSKQYRRYYLHRKLKGHFEIDSEKREIDISPYQSAKDIPTPQRWYVGQLIKLGYNAQFKLL